MDKPPKLFMKIPKLFICANWPLFSFQIDVDAPTHISNGRLPPNKISRIFGPQQKHIAAHLVFNTSVII